MENVKYYLPKTKSPEKKYENNYKATTLYLRNDLRQFYDDLCQYRGSRQNIGNHSMLIFKAIYDDDVKKLAELMQLVHEFKQKGYYTDKEEKQHLKKKLD